MIRLVILGITLGFLATPLVAEAQPEGKTYRVGTLTTASQAEGARYIKTLEDGLRKLGWVEGRTLAFEHRYANLRPERLPDLAAELVRLKVDVIVAGSNSVIAAARGATTMLPIVTVFASRPVESGFVASLARPGGNVTGLTIDVAPETTGKRLQLLKEVAPRLSRVAVLRYFSGRAADRKATEDAARTLGVTVQGVDVRGPGDFDRAFAAIAHQRADGLYVWLHPAMITLRGRIVDFAARNRLPAVYESREFADAGGLMTYGVDNHDLYRRAATYVDRILRGAKPADLPIEQPIKFELVINGKTAKALGLTIPPSVLLQADHVIE
jgi:ABC-type uncharacterized transport system substrate-binding protein